MSAFLVAVSLLLVTGCATVPITGRTQLNMISDDRVRIAAADTYSRFVSLVRQKNLVVSDTESPQAAAILANVRRVSDRIVDAAGLRDRYYWETVVVKAREANAFVTPNGKIVVFTGLLPIAKTEAGLAAVIGHEVSHVIARHQAERMSQALLAQMAVTAVDVALAASNSKYQPIVGAALGLGAQYGVLLPFSRAHESEADHIGLLLMAKAGYDPSEAVGLWERMEAAGGSGPWEFLSTHPSHETRREQIRELLPEANLYFENQQRPLPTNLTEIRGMVAERAALVAAAPVAVKPAFQSGFWYRKKKSDQPRMITYVNRLEPCPFGECIVTAGDNGETTLSRADWAVVEVRRADGSWIRFSPPVQPIRWPLRVGDSWSETITVEESTGKRTTVAFKFNVVAYESTSVPAGSFMAFKFVSTAGGRKFSESWYSPETRTVVKTVSYNAQGSSIVSELVDYQKSDEPASAINAPQQASPMPQQTTPAQDATNMPTRMPLREYLKTLPQKQSMPPASSSAPPATLCETNGESYPCR